MRKLSFIWCLALVCQSAFSQASQGAQAKPTGTNQAGTAATGTTQAVDPVRQIAMQDALRKKQSIVNAERDGVEVRVKDVARFRGVRSNQLTGVGLVVGLEGTGDSKKTPATATLLQNYLKANNIAVNVANMDEKNVALVLVQAILPPFAKPGSAVDVRVSSMGDAKSLQGGVLIQTPLYAAGNFEQAYAVADGAISIGGFNVESGGSKVQQNHVNVGRIPSGGIVENRVDTKIDFNGRMYLDLDTYDLTTSQRVADRINELFPAYKASPMDGATVELSIPAGKTSMAMAEDVENVTVYADVPAVVIINERTGTIVVGGNVKIGPALIAKGSLTVRIEQDTMVSQPNSLSNGTTVTTKQTTIDAGQSTAQVALLPPTTTIADLAKIFQALELEPRDIISILQDLRTQGALKARVEIQ